MARTAAERQAAYRARRATAGNDGNGERRLSMWVTTEADPALARLAHRYSVTKRVMLERMIVRADAAIVRNIPAARQGLRTMSARANSIEQKRSFSGACLLANR